MPKRKRDKHLDSDYKHIAKKLKKLERKIKHSRRRHRSSSSSDSDMQSPHNSPESKSIAIVDDLYDDNEMYSPGRSSWYDFSDSVNERSCGAAAQLVVADVHSPPVDVPHPRSAVVAVPHAAATAPPAAAQLRTAPLEDADAILSIDISAPPPTEKTYLLGIPPSQQPSDGNATCVDSKSQPNESEQVVDLDSDLMEILGEDPTCRKEYGPDIQKDLALRLNHIVTSGLTKENHKEIKEKYLIPGNCKLVKAPTLNPEIGASLVESQAKRDEGIENKQNMAACALSSLSAAITLLLSLENKNRELLRLMMDTARILGDIQHSDSILRRFFILSTVKKDLKDQLEKTKIDEMLFGENLSDALKSAKIISRSGADIRSATNARTTSQTTTRPPARPLNYRTPPANRRPAAAGAPRGARALPPAPPAPTPRQTTTRGTPHGVTRTSSRQPHTRYRC